MASDTSLIFNLIAKDKVSKALGPVAAKLSSFGTNIGKAMGGIGVAAPHVAAAATAATALAAAGVGAAVGLGGFAAAVKPQLEGVTDAMALYEKTLDNTGQKTKAVALEQKKYEQAIAGLPTATRKFAEELVKTKDAHSEWSASLAKSTMPVFTKGLRVLRALMPQLTPVIKSVSGVLNEFMGQVLKAARSKEFGAWVKDFSATAGTTLRDGLTIASNLVTGLLGVLRAFLPESSGVTGGLASMSTAFRDWGTSLPSSDGLTKFQDFASTSGPALATLGTAVADLVVSLGPFLGSTAVIAAAFADIIAATPAPVITALGQVFLVTVVGVKAWTAAMIAGKAAAAAWTGVTTLVNGLRTMGAGFASAQVAQSALSGGWGTAGGKLRSLTTSVQTATVASGKWIASTVRAAAAQTASTARAIAATTASVAQTAATWVASTATTAWAATTAALNAAWLACPVVWIVLLIAALIAIVVLAYKKNETFRKIVDAAWAGIKKAISATVSWIKSNVPPAWAKIMSAAKAVWSWIKSAWGSIKSAITKPFTSAAATAKSVWGKLKDWFSGLKSSFSSIGSGIVDGLWGGISAKWDSMVSWLSGKAASLPSAVKKVLGIASPSRVFHKLGWHVAEGMARGIKGGWSKVTDALQRGLKSVQSEYDKAKSKLQSTKGNWSQAYASVRDTFKGQAITERGSSVQEMQSSLRQQIERSKAMVDALKTLKKRGLSKELLAQLAAAGPDALEQAQAILSSGQSGVNDLNALQRSLGSVSKKAGTFAADVLYKDALKDQTRELRKLERELRELRKAITLSERKEKQEKKKNKKRKKSGKGLAAGETYDDYEVISPGLTPRPAADPIEIRVSDSEVGKLLYGLLRKEIQRSGRGDVQIALGRA